MEKPYERSSVARSLARKSVLSQGQSLVGDGQVNRDLTVFPHVRKSSLSDRVPDVADADGHDRLGIIGAAVLGAHVRHLRQPRQGGRPRHNDLRNPLLGGTQTMTTDRVTAQQEFQMRVAPRQWLSTAGTGKPR